MKMIPLEMIESLSKMGLSTPEAKAFIGLTMLGNATGTDLAQHTELPQPKVYGYLKSLIEKGYVKESDVKGRSKIYVSEPFTYVINDLREKLNLNSNKLEKYLEVVSAKSIPSEDTYFFMSEGERVVKDAIKKICAETNGKCLIFPVYEFHGYILDQFAKYNIEFINGAELLMENTALKIVFSKIKNILTSSKKDNRPYLIFTDVDEKKQTARSTVIITPSVGNPPILLEIKQPVIVNFQISAYYTLKDVINQFLEEIKSGNFDLKKLFQSIQ